MTKLFVCYDAVTTLTEQFCQNAKNRPDRIGWRRRRLVASAEPTVELDRSAPVQRHISGAQAPKFLDSY
jgi:hypothetical protein